MVKTVYKVIRFEIEDESNMKKMEDSLNKHAEKGWELVNSILTDTMGSQTTCILKGKG